MNRGYEDINFNEAQARYLVDYLLEEDIPVFKKLSSEIRAMDSHSFKNLFQGIRFKSAENADGFDYKVKNKKSFQELLEKFDNFYNILDSWYSDKKYYSYIKDLWLNYISIKDLVEKNENDREELLQSYDIDYKNWPENIKIEFIRIIRLDRNKNIFSKQRMEEIEEAHNEFKYLLKEMYAFKSKIETEPEMETYEKNTDNFIKKIKSFLGWLKGLTEGKIGKVSSVVGSFPLIQALYGTMTNDNNLPSEKINNYDNDYDYDDDFDYLDSEDNDEINSGNETLKENIKNLLKNTNLGLYIYSALSFIHLGLSVWEFTNAYNDLAQIKKNIKDDKGYEKKLKEIEENFKKNKEKIGILPDDFKEALKIIKETFKEICGDYINLNNLIQLINNDIEIAKSHETKSTLGLIGSVCLGVGGFFVTKDPFCFLHTTSLTLNIGTGIGHIMVLANSKEIIKQLKEILKKAKKQKKEMEAKLDDLIKVIKDLEKGQLPKSEKKFIVNYEKKTKNKNIKNS